MQKYQIEKMYFLRGRPSFVYSETRRSQIKNLQVVKRRRGPEEKVIENYALIAHRILDEILFKLPF